MVKPVGFGSSGGSHVPHCEQLYQEGRAAYNVAEEALSKFQQNPKDLTAKKTALTNFHKALTAFYAVDKTGEFGNQATIDVHMLIDDSWNGIFNITGIPPEELR